MEVKTITKCQIKEAIIHMHKTIPLGIFSKTRGGGESVAHLFIFPQSLDFLID